MESIVEQFRQAAPARQAGRRSPGRYPTELRELALSHLANVRRQGGRASQAARDLGVDANTLRVWEKKQPRPARGSNGTLLPVEVSPSATKAVAVPYVVVGPQGAGHSSMWRAALFRNAPSARGEPAELESCIDRVSDRSDRDVVLAPAIGCGLF